MRKRNYILGLFLLGIFILSMALGTKIVVADEDDDDDDGVDDDREEWNERDVEVETDDDEITIKSELRNGDRKDEFKIKVDFEDDEGLEIEVKYESGIESEEEEDEDDESDDEKESRFLLSSSSEYELEFEVDIHDIIEYVDLNGNGLYDGEPTDKKIQTYQIGSVGFNTPSYSERDLDDGSTLHKITISTADGVFTTIIYVVEEFEEISGTIITPTEAKIDIIIENFNYINDTSQLALYIKLSAEEEYEEEDETEDEDEGYAEDEDGVKTKSSDIDGIFTWSETAVVDGVSQPVLVNAKENDHEDEDEEKLYFNYKRGTKIVHDPKIGVSGVLLESAPVNISMIIGLVASMIGVMVAIITVDVLIKKRKSARLLIE